MRAFLKGAFDVLGIAVMITVVWAMADFYRGKPPADYLLLFLGVAAGATCARIDKG